MPAQSNAAHIDATWLNEPQIGATSYVIPASWAIDPRYIGATVPKEKTNFGTMSVNLTEVYAQSVLNAIKFGAPQVTHPFDYVAPNVFLNVAWKDEPYTAPVFNVTANWSDAIYIAPVSIESTSEVGTPFMVFDQVIAPLGMSTTVVGSPFVTHWYEYAPPVWTLNGSWVGKLDYAAPEGLINVNWLPDIGEQFIAMTGIGPRNTNVPLPRARNLNTVTVEGISPQSEIGFHDIESKLCNESWQRARGDEVHFNFNELWTSAAADQVDFTFECILDCDNLWGRYDSRKIAIPFNTPWKEYDSRFIPVAFKCETDEGDSYTLFSGYFDGEHGEVSSFDFTDTWILTAQDGQWIGGRTCNTPIQVDLQNAQSRGGFVDAVLNRASLRTNGGATDGTNVSHNTSVDTNNAVTSVSWRQSLTGPFYDNDNTDAVVRFEFVDTNTVAEIVIPTGSWRYADPHKGPGQRTFSLYIPFDQTSSLNLGVKNSDQSDQSSGQSFTFPIKDLYKGNVLIRAELEAAGTNATKFSVWFDDVLVASHVFGSQPIPAKVIPLWHYHNYSNPATIYEIRDVTIRGCEEFLSTYPQIGLPVYAQTGESAIFDLATTYNFPLNAHAGEVGIVNLATANTLDANAYEGQALTVGFTVPIPADLAHENRTGEAAEILIATSSIFRDVVSYAGEVATVDLKDSPAPDLLLEAQQGEVAVLALQVPAALGVISAFHGDALSFVSMDTAENYRFYTGESVSAFLATDTTLPAALYTGEYAETSLEVRPSEGLGMFRAYAGEESDIVVSTLEQVLLYPVTISARDYFTCEFDLNTNVDLQNKACCPQLEHDTHAHIELNDGPAVDERYDGDKTIVQLDLRTLPRFTFDMHAGEGFTLADPNYLGTFQAYDGHAPVVNDLDFEYINFRLCFGNFIPDAGNLFIELLTEYAEDCASDIIFTGEEAHMELENNVQAAAHILEGQWMTIDLVLESNMLFRVWTGEHARISNPEFSVHYHTGEGAQFVFEETNWYGYTGESMTLETLTTEYDVEFLEQGCLDNEFVPSNENGDPDWDKFNEVPVELEFYTHSIRAHCF